MCCISAMVSKRRRWRVLQERSTKTATNKRAGERYGSCPTSPLIQDERLPTQPRDWRVDWSQAVSSWRTGQPIIRCSAVSSSRWHRSQIGSTLGSMLWQRSRVKSSRWLKRNCDSRMGGGRKRAERQIASQSSSGWARSICPGANSGVRSRE